MRSRELAIWMLHLFSIYGALVKSARVVVPTSSAIGVRLRPEVVDELRDFVGLIPKATVDEIIAEHYVVDGNFRKALKYLRSDEFPKMLQRLQQIPEIIEILHFLQLIECQQSESPSTTDSPFQPLQPLQRQQQRHQKLIAARTMCESSQLALDAAKAEAKAKAPLMVEQLEIVLLNSRGRAKSGQSVAYELRTFSSFVEELLRHLPRDRYVQMINEKRQRSAAFAEFYGALRSAKLRPMLDAALASASLANAISELAAHNIDVHSLEPIAFTVISWGPPAGTM